MVCAWQLLKESQWIPQLLCDICNCRLETIMRLRNIRLACVSVVVRVLRRTKSLRPDISSLQPIRAIRPLNIHMVYALNMATESGLIFPRLHDISGGERLPVMRQLSIVTVHVWTEATEFLLMLLPPPRISSSPPTRITG
jgi:hypothetical protein